MARDTRRGDAPTIYPLGHPRNPVTQASASAPAARPVPTAQPIKLAAPAPAATPTPAPTPAPAAPADETPAPDAAVQED